MANTAAPITPENEGYQHYCTMGKNARWILSFATFPRETTLIH